MAAPPLSAGAVHWTVAEPLPAVAVPMVGAPGAVTPLVGVTVLEEAEKAPVPALLVAATWKW